MTGTKVGFVGAGRLGFPLACALIDAGFEVMCTSRGNAAELVAHGATVPGDGTSRAVAQAADVVATCLPSADSLREVATGVDGLLAADDPAPLIELSTLPLSVKTAVREHFVMRGVDMLDAPVSGSPAMAQAGIAVIYASGERRLYERFGDVVKAMSPNHKFVGDFGTGTKMKFVAQFLVIIHATAAAEAMAYAGLAGLDLHHVAELISASPGAMSGQFKMRAPLMAAGQFEGRLVTTDMAVKDLNAVIEYGREIAAPTDLLDIVRDRYRQLIDGGHGGADPSVLMEILLTEASVEKR